MKMSYNLNDNVNDSFDFELGGKKYTMTYPTLEDIDKLQKIIQDNPDDNDKMMEFLYSYITSKDGEDIKNVLPKQNIRVIQNFTKMVKTEFDIGD